jgi:hypothetical protein
VFWEQMQLLKWKNRNTTSPDHYNTDPVDGERAVVKSSLAVWLWEMPSAWCSVLDIWVLKVLGSQDISEATYI